ncbi:hypothetical protein V1279_003407 [Bradyrhizobium sp. AZCC 1610]
MAQVEGSGRVVGARIAGDLGPTLLHPDGNLLGQAVFTQKWLQRRSSLRPQPCAVTPEISFGSRMHEASLQYLEAVTKRTLRKGDGLLMGAYDDRAWRIIFLPANVSARLIELIESFNPTHNFRQGNRGQSA